MLCPIKFVDPSAHANMQCDPQCAWRAAEIINQTSENIDVYYYCGLISNSTRIEIVNLDGPVSIPLNRQVVDNSMQIVEEPEEPKELGESEE